MEEFILKGGGDYLRIEIVKVFDYPDNTSFEGGYDTESTIEINSDGFKVNATLWVSTGAFFSLHEQLLIVHEQIKGEAYLRNFEENLECIISYRDNGHVIIYGTFKNNNELENSLNFHFKSDQSYIQVTLKQLAQIVNKYGGMKGIKK